MTGLTQAIAFVRARCDAYVAEHGFYDPSTGVTEFPGNGDETVSEWEEIIEGLEKLRAVEPTPPARDLVERLDLRYLLGELRTFVDAVAGENRPARAWAIDLRDKIDAAAATIPVDPEQDEQCPVCAVSFKLGDTCATDIELGMCHAKCLEGSPTVDLDTGELIDGPIGTYPFEVDPQDMPVLQAVRAAAEYDVLAERRRQIEQEGWTPAHDDRHRSGELAIAAACYALNATDDADGPEIRFVGAELWPLADGWWKPTNERRDLVKAGALIIAEIERLDRRFPHNIMTDLGNTAQSAGGEDSA